MLWPERGIRKDRGGYRNAMLHPYSKRVVPLVRLSTRLMKCVDNLGKRWTFIIAVCCSLRLFRVQGMVLANARSLAQACCGLLGVIIAFFFVEDKGKDRLEKEDELWRLYLVEHGHGDLTMGDGSAGDRKADANEESEELEFEH